MRENSRDSTKIQAMFSSIAPQYDFLNRLLSLGIDRSWRRAAAHMLTCRDEGLVLDIATGTGDMALAAAKQCNRIVAVDFSEAMLRIARKKIQASHYRHNITLAAASCEALPFRANTFDSAVIAFGIRNVSDRLAGLGEILRVLRPGGRVVVLELSTPRSRAVRALYHCYFRWLLPALGALFSNGAAYRYLPDSVLAFPDAATFSRILAAAGFSNVRHKGLTLGIVTVFCGEKGVTPFSDTLPPSEPDHRHLPM